ncbi:hypothetical protein [Natrinema soli]|uniref:Uncharacterized protein n=1 Tax=Natrinema soli TaxID=1930624 RepID=A0ABD5SWG6_9EURY|nr:hypothetical protein [Natrinema soli]
MIDRSTFVAAFLVIAVIASPPAVAYSGASGPSSSSNEAAQLADGNPLDSLACLPSPTLENISMNAYKQEATNLQTKSGDVSATSTGPSDGQDTFGIESGLIAASTICFSGSDHDRESIELQLNDVGFEDTKLIGPWTDVEFEQGEADSMTVVLSPEAVLDLLKQLPDSINAIKTIKNLFGIEDYGIDETDPAANETDDTEDNTTDPDDDTGDNTTDSDNDTGDDIVTDPVDDTEDDMTDPVDNSTDETTDAVDDTVDNTTDTVNDTTNNTADAIDDTTNNTTDAVDGTVDTTTDAVDDTTNNTTDAVDDTVDDTALDEPVDNTTDAVDETVDGTTDVVDDTVDGTTDIIGGITDGTTDAISATTDSIIG